MQNGKFSAFAELFVRTLKKVDFLKQRKKFIHVKDQINKLLSLKLRKCFYPSVLKYFLGAQKNHLNDGSFLVTTRHILVN